MTGRRPVLQLDLTGHSRGGVAILGPISLSMSAQDTVALIGPSGIGKTTLLRLIAGLEPAMGQVDVVGRVAMVFQEPTLLPWRTARQNLTLTAGITDQAAAVLLAEVGLDGLAGRFPGQMSLGQQRRLSLARAFAVRPDLLLMDEPFVSLDPGLAAEMMEVFARLRATRPLATLIVTHVETEAAHLASRIIRLGGRPAQIVEDRPNAGGAVSDGSRSAPPDRVSFDGATSPRQGERHGT